MGYDNRKAWIRKAFESYGFTPPEGVLDALTSTIPLDDQKGVGAQEVGAYINAFNAMQKAAATDPLSKLLVDESSALSDAGTLSGTYAQQLQDVYKQAPKLFGSLTPDQIEQYEAPLKTAFDYSTGVATGEANRRGNVGSSLEAQALAQTKQKFDENVLQTGLNVGMTQQQNLAQVIQNLYNQKMQQQNLLYGLQQSTAGQLSSNQLQNAEFMAQLPILLQGNAVQNAAMNQKQDSTPWGAIGSLVGMGAGAFAGPGGMMLGGMLGGGVGNVAQGFTGGNNAMTSGGASQLSMLPLLYGGMNGGFKNPWGWTSGNNASVPGGMNWASQPGNNTGNQNISDRLYSDAG